MEASVAVTGDAFGTADHRPHARGGDDGRNAYELLDHGFGGANARPRDGFATPMPIWHTVAQKTAVREAPRR